MTSFDLFNGEWVPTFGHFNVFAMILPPLAVQYFHAKFAKEIGNLSTELFNSLADTVVASFYTSSRIAVLGPMSPFRDFIGQFDPRELRGNVRDAIVEQTYNAAAKGLQGQTPQRKRSVKIETSFFQALKGELGFSTGDLGRREQLTDPIARNAIAAQWIVAPDKSITIRANAHKVGVRTGKTEFVAGIIPLDPYPVYFFKPGVVVPLHIHDGSVRRNYKIVVQ
ncbi:MAG: hypothetical protein ACRDAM_18605 [Casimicrobium sp.]